MAFPQTNDSSGPGPGAAFRLGDHTVLPDANRIDHHHLEPKSMAVLLLLAEAAPRVVRLQTVIERVWNNTSVSDAVVHRAVSRLRHALDDDPRRPRFIDTVPRRGYRLLVSAESAEAPAVTFPSPPRRAPGAVALIAVLPFDNLSGQAALQHFCNGLCEEILQTLARTTGIKVIGRSSSFQFRGAAKAVQHVAAELRCSHVLDGAVRSDGRHVRISVQLIECRGQTTVWSEELERELSNVFALQDEIAAGVARAVAIYSTGGEGRNRVVSGKGPASGHLRRSPPGPQHRS